jgi:hypothetical protein
LAAYDAVMPMDRPLTSPERAILDFLLTAEFQGRAALRAQVDHARASGRCPCGCATVDLAVDRTAAPPAQVSERMVADAMSRDGEYGLLLFVDDGYLSSVEIYGNVADPPPEFPPPSEFLEPLGHPPSYAGSKESLPSGESYPIKRSLLHAAVAGANTKCVRQMDYMRDRAASGDVLAARYVGVASSNWQQTMRGLVSIRVYAIPSCNRKAVEDELVATALPMLTDWLAKVEHAESVWRGSDHELVFTFRDGKLRHRST